jgi:Putative polyhydroxyalkanoic acid system protein (PHA_gran_rgn)
MRVIVPHHTDKTTARRKIDERIAQALAQYGHYLSESTHAWDGDRLTFSGAARGFKASGTIELTDTEVIIDGKLPLIAKPFEPRVKHAIEREAETMFGNG